MRGSRACLQTSPGKLHEHRISNDHSCLDQVIGQRSPEIIYVESFARVTSLSLSGKISKNVVDKFIVQWPMDGSAEGQKSEKAEDTKVVEGDSKVQYAGWLI